MKQLKTNKKIKIFKITNKAINQILNFLCNNSKNQQFNSWKIQHINKLLQQFHKF